MNICVFDTETVSLDKPFCYNVGYIIYNTETRTILTEEDYVVNEIFYNKELFSLAFFSNKREEYLTKLETGNTISLNWNRVMYCMAEDLMAFDVKKVYAYNSDFDEKVFEFNCKWFDVMNPLNGVEVFDIRGHAINFLVDDNYKNFCDEYKFYTEYGNYSTTAEVMYRYLTDLISFVESHTALDDCEIELEILIHATQLDKKKLNTHYIPPKSIRRKVKKHFTVVDGETKNTLFETNDFTKIVYYKDSGKIYLS